MRTMSLKLNTYVKSVGVINNNLEKFFLDIIFWSFGVLALLYVVFLGNMVKNIVERRSLEVDTRSLSTEVRDLELTYLSMSNNIDLNLSHSLGFKEAQTTFASRKSLGLIPQNEPFGNIKIAQNEL